MPARSLWQGSISFGLVNIPVKLYSATNNKEYVFNQLCQNGHRIRYKKWCPEEEREVPFSEIKKGYEIEKNNYIVFEKEELNKIKLKTTHSIDIKEFIEYKELDPILIDNSYYVAIDPKKGNEKAYALLVKILNENNLVAIGKVVLKDRENVIALRPYQRGLVMHVLNYLDDMKPVDEIPEMGNTKAKLDTQEISLGKILVQKYRSKEFDIGDYSDTYVQELRKLIEAKSKGRKFVPSAPKVAKPTKDLLEALKASIETKRK
ncbi:MAG TPA: Ku protein [Nitrososphaeraceae archaeon]